MSSRVGHEVVDGTCKRTAVATNECRRGGGWFDELRDVDGLHYRTWTGLHPREREQIVDEIAQSSRVLQGPGQQLLARCRISLMQCDLELRMERRKWTSELMRDITDELPLPRSGG